MNIHDIRNRNRKRLPLIVEMAKEILRLKEEKNKWREKAAKHGDISANVEISIEHMRRSLACQFYGDGE